ncbi:hypothetical protein [Prevotella sp. tf2-5]|uniref:hypothetical protein n=1 Tax=Prevotella sp. tf2-5 TaxID=1761889 RepID=UPI0008E4887B|nr:hypothetical protein [Prevotella sp. tf2-5]SFP02226.1 hypothetical protein SAMN04487852_11330 [Prevotella sp. tf2-5]
MAGGFDKQQMKTLQGITKNVHTMRHHCQVDGCEEAAINSHLLQRNGILNNIAENNHLIEARPTDFFKWNAIDCPIEFRQVGINQAISLSVFCDKHDTELFKKIEQGNLDFGDYETQLLLSYRVVCAEIVKKEQNIEITKRIQRANTLNFPAEMLNTELKGYQLGLRDLNEYRKLIESELNAPTSKFHFRRYSYSKIAVAASATFSYEVDAGTSRGIEKSFEGKVWDTGFIHVIPTGTSLEIVVGYHEDHTNDYLVRYIDSWANLDDVALKMQLTDLFAARIEGWVMSPSLFKSLSNGAKDKFMRYFSDNAANYNMLQRPDFSLFDK